MTIDLYTWTTPNGEKPIILLEELDLDYRLHLVDIGSGAQKEEDFLAINPNGRIPAMTIDGYRVFESGAMMVHLAEREGRFLAEDGAARAETLSWVFFQMGGTGPMIGQWYHFAKSAPEQLPYAIERYRDESMRLLGVLDKRLAEHEYLATDYSIADMINFSWARGGMDAFTDQGSGEYRALAAWIERIGNRPAVVRALEKLSAAKKTHKAS